MATLTVNSVDDLEESTGIPAVEVYFEFEAKYREAIKAWLLSEDQWIEHSRQISNLEMEGNSGSFIELNAWDYWKPKAVFTCC